jgi:hypothetical protein
MLRFLARANVRMQYIFGSLEMACANLVKQRVI